MKQIVQKLTEFIKEIGLEVHFGDIDHETFLPGIDVRNGTLVVDEGKLKYPGDLLHEAGHLAVMTASERARAGTTIDTGGGEEMAAIAWSYAAAVHLKIDPEIVFHPNGYQGASESILENFDAGFYFGVPTLQWMGMTAGKKKAAELNVEPYPKMAKWLKD